MALHLKVSNSLEKLADSLSDDLRTAGDGVFDPYYLVTQTDGMNNWPTTSVLQPTAVFRSLTS
jgi:exodeoxyribonuclease V gamma subunit